jgi:amidase
LVGLKPSRGWVPVGPRHDELAGGLDCEHVLSRSVRDTALMLDLTQGPEPTSRYPLRQPTRGFLDALREAPRPLRIGIALRTAGGDEPADEVGAAVTEAAELLAKAGHRVVEFQYPKSSAHIAEPAAVIWMTATAEEIDYSRGLLAGGPKSNDLEALSWACVALGGRRTALDYVRSRRMLTQATRDMNGAFQSIDVLLLPTTGQCALPTGSIDGRTANFDLERWNADSYGYAPYTELFNVTGQPAISLPLAQSKSGLPIGVQIVAPLGEDASLLTLAAWLERERPWATRLAEMQRRYLTG